MQRRVTPAHQGGDHLHTRTIPARRWCPDGGLERLIGFAGRRSPAPWCSTRPTATSATIPKLPTVSTLVRRHPTVIALRTFSKIAGLAGLRVGYAIARPEAIERLNRVRAPYNVNGLAQIAAVAALDDKEHLDRTRDVILAERPRLREASAARGAPSPPSQANFLRQGRGPRLRHPPALLGAGILVRDGAGVGFPGHLRIAIGTLPRTPASSPAWDKAAKS